MSGSMTLILFEAALSTSRRTNSWYTAEGMTCSQHTAVAAVTVMMVSCTDGLSNGSRSGPYLEVIVRQVEVDQAAQVSKLGRKLSAVPDTRAPPFSRMRSANSQAMSRRRCTRTRAGCG